MAFLMGLTPNLNLHLKYKHTLRDQDKYILYSEMLQGDFEWCYFSL